MPPPDRLRRGLPLVAMTMFVVVVGAVIASSALTGTLGFDFLAYHAAASRVLAGQPLYDMSFVETGGFGLFYYPPTFAPLVLPFGLLPEGLAVWTWTGLLVVAFVVGVALLPVSLTVRWLVLLLGALSWPTAYAIKLGQVGPILFLLFTAAWRWLESPRVLGVTAALGSAIKIQPGLVLVWALLARRGQAVLCGIVTLAVLAAVATLVAGVEAWSDFFTLVVRVSDPITTEHNFTPGAIAYQLGLSHESASVLQWMNLALALAAVVVAAMRLGPVPGYLVAVVASQLVSPVLWDHYAMLLLLPVAWLLAQGRSWAALIPLATVTPLASVTPAVVYPIAFWVTLIATLGTGWRTGDQAVLEPATA